MKWLAADFWDYSLRYYGMPQVKEVCLYLQNNFGFNVNLILLSGYADKQQVMLEKIHWDRLSQVSETIISDVTAIREQRCKVDKTLNPQKYKGLLAQEITLERKHQSILIECVNEFDLKPTTDSNMLSMQRYFDNPNLNEIKHKEITQLLEDLKLKNE